MGSAPPPQDEFSDYEKVYLQMSRAFKPIGKEHWGIHCACTISGDHEGAAILNAWKCLAVEYPGLTVRPGPQFTKEFDGLDESILDNWAKLTFTVDVDKTADSIIQSAGPRDLPSLHFLPASQELVFLGQHWRTDALGCCIIMSRLVDHLAKQRSPIEFLRQARPMLSPSLETAAGSSFDVDEEIRTYAFQHIETFHAQAVRSGGLPYVGDAAKPPGNTMHRELTLSTEFTGDVVKTCKALGISVSAAVHTALAQTYFSFTDAEEEKEKGYTTVMAVNARPHLQPPYNETSHACQTYVASIIPTVPYRSDFVAASKDLTRQYKTWCSDKLMKSLCWAYRYHLEKLFKPAATQSAPRKPPSGVTLSSLGVVEQHLASEHGDIGIEKFRFGVSMMTRQTLLYAWTFRGQLTLSLDYNDAYCSEEMVSQVLSRVRDHLSVGLKLIE